MTGQGRERINAETLAATKHQLERAQEDCVLLTTEIDSMKQAFEGERQTLLGRIRDLEDLPAV